MAEEDSIQLPKSHFKSSSEVAAAVKETEPLVAPSPSESSEVTAFDGDEGLELK